MHRITFESSCSLLRAGSHFVDRKIVPEQSLLDELLARSQVSLDTCLRHCIGLWVDRLEDVLKGGRLEESPPVLTFATEGNFIWRHVEGLIRHLVAFLETSERHVMLAEKDRT